MMEVNMKLKLWMIDLAGGAIMAAIILAAYVFDGPKNPSNAIKPTITQSEHLLLCLDGMRPVDFRCPDGERL